MIITKGNDALKVNIDSLIFRLEHGFKSIFLDKLHVKNSNIWRIIFSGLFGSGYDNASVSDQFSGLIVLHNP